MSEVAPTRRSVVTPVVLSALSQGLSGSSNFVVILALGRFGGSDEVGRYTLAFIAYSGALGVQRAALTDALMARRLDSTAPLRIETSRALVCSGMISVPVAIAVLAGGLIAGSTLFVTLAVVLVPVLLQDAERYVLFRNGRHAVAALLDGLWLVTSCAVFLVLPSHPTAEVALAMWGVGGACAAVLGLLLLRTPPVGLRVSYFSWRDHLLPSSRWLVLETVLFQVDQQVLAFGFTALVGAAVFGTYQLAGSLVGVAITVTTGISVVAVSRFTHGRGSQFREAAIVTAVSFSLVALVTLVFAMTSDFVTGLLYGDDVVIPASIIIPTGAIYATVASAGGVHALLRARRTERVLPLARAITFAIFVPVALVVSAHDFPLALWVVALQGVVFLAITWRVAVRASRATLGVEEVAVDVVV